MKKKTTLCVFMAVVFGFSSYAQTTPPSSAAIPSESYDVRTTSDTIDFTGYVSNTIITNQYLYTGAFFSGYNGSLDPVTHDYGSSSYGSVLHSDNWYNALRLNFVNPFDSSLYSPVNYVEFDNPVGPSETDYISVDIYDTNDVLIYHYVSTSPEHIVINLGSNIGAYMTFDDSAGTAFVIDNIIFNNDELPTGIFSAADAKDMNIFPVPCTGMLTVSFDWSLSTAALTVFDVRGEKLNVPVLKTESGFLLNCSSLSRGMYFLQIASEDREVMNGKFIVN